MAGKYEANNEYSLAEQLALAEEMAARIRKHGTSYTVDGQTIQLPSLDSVKADIADLKRQISIESSSGGAAENVVRMTRPGGSYSSSD